MKAVQITPREAFLYICFNMISVDRNIDDREIDALYAIVRRYGFTRDEIQHVAHTVEELGRDRAFERGVASIEIAKKLDDTMKENLLAALLEIGEADKKVLDSELSFFYTVKTELGLKVK